MINRELDSYSKWQNGAQTFSIFNALVLHTAGIFATIVQLGSTDYLEQQCLNLKSECKCCKQTFESKKNPITVQKCASYQTHCYHYKCVLRISVTLQMHKLIQLTFCQWYPSPTENSTKSNGIKLQFRSNFLVDSRHSATLQIRCFLLEKCLPSCNSILFFLTDK